MIATKIKQIILADTSIFTADLTTAATAKAAIDAAIAAVTGGTAESVTNVHEKTWQIEESDASMNNYHNELDGSVYRRDPTAGDLTVAFTLGEYSEKLKAAVRGGSTITKGGDGTDKADIIGYRGDAPSTSIIKAMFCLTQDGYWFIYPKAQIMANTKETDDAAALSVSGYPMKPDMLAGVMSTEYNFNSALLS